MADENHTIRLLTEMCEEMRNGFANVHKEMGAMDRAITETRGEIQEVRDEARTEREALRKRVVEGEVRTSTELLAVSGSLDEIKALIRQQAAIKMVVTGHEQRIRKLEGE